MDRKEKLLARLDAIGQSLAANGNALALLGLGSVGQELDRIDAYSDLDFFAIVRPGFKQVFIGDMGWLSAPAPLAYYFQNTVDGYKALYADGIFCEFAVFEPAELAGIPFAPGRIVWKATDFDDALAAPPKPSPREDHTVEWLVGEALTNLYVGLGRYRRGEKLSAARLIQVFAIDRLLELSRHIEKVQPSHADPFAPERRYEQRFPQMAALLPQFVQGYERSPESALAILQFLDRHFQVNPHLKNMILELCQNATPADNG